MINLRLPLIVAIAALLLAGGCSFSSEGETESETEAPGKGYIEDAEKAKDTVEQSKPPDVEEGKESEEGEDNE